MGWCFIYYKYDGLGGVSYNVDMMDGVVLHIISELRMGWCFI